MINLLAGEVKTTA